MARLQMPMLGVGMLLLSISAGLSHPKPSRLPPLETHQTAQVPAETTSVRELARLVTVRLLLAEDSGSGVIVDREGDRYTLLTNWHVVMTAQGQDISVLTPDGRTHSGRVLPPYQLGNRDLARVAFSSPHSYQVAAVGEAAEVSVGDRVYAAGYPARVFERQGDRIVRSHDTRDWGLRAFRVTEGAIGWITARAFYGGYQLGYTNDVSGGMSGGPVLNAQGQLIGLNGMLSYPFLGIRAFVFEDGGLPSQDEFLQMERLSWAVPIQRLPSATSRPEAPRRSNPAPRQPLPPPEPPAPSREQPLPLVF
ncbi:MAG: serine protease [Sodalinema sp.]|uniref:S1 family peptidase n=1 Tax=Sodalinema sp. TaxID=3080550 RepID=UPI0012180ED1|nr:MAG: serine protease [Phormidium sp. SL48-SHIP]